jgi:hypothetical protein
MPVFSNQLFASEMYVLQDAKVIRTGITNIANWLQSLRS